MSQLRLETKSIQGMPLYTPSSQSSDSPHLGERGDRSLRAGSRRVQIEEHPSTSHNSTTKLYIMESRAARA